MPEFLGTWFIHEINDLELEFVSQALGSLFEDVWGEVVDERELHDVLHDFLRLREYYFKKMVKIGYNAIIIDARELMSCGKRERCRINTFVLKMETVAELKEHV